METPAPTHKFFSTPTIDLHPTSCKAVDDNASQGHASGREGPTVLKQTTYDWCWEGGLKALTREKRSGKRRCARPRPRPLYYSADVPGPFRPLRSHCRQRYHKPSDCLHRMLPDVIFLALWALQDGRCYICAKAFTPDDWATSDHVTPRTRGGAVDGSNELLACMACNQGKADTMPTPCELLYLAGVNLRFVAVLRSVEAGQERMQGVMS